MTASGAVEPELPISAPHGRGSRVQNVCTVACGNFTNLGNPNRLGTSTNALVLWLPERLPTAYGPGAPHLGTEMVTIARSPIAGRGRSAPTPPAGLQQRLRASYSTRFF